MPARTAFHVYNARFVFYPVPCPWRELTLMMVPETNCEGNQLNGRMESIEARGPRHPEEQGGAIGDVFPGKIPHFLSRRPLQTGRLAFH